MAHSGALVPACAGAQACVSARFDMEDLFCSCRLDYLEQHEFATETCVRRERMRMRVRMHACVGVSVLISTGLQRLLDKQDSLRSPSAVSQLSAAHEGNGKGD